MEKIIQDLQADLQLMQAEKMQTSDLIVARAQIQDAIVRLQMHVDACLAAAEQTIGK